MRKLNVVTVLIVGVNERALLFNTRVRPKEKKKHPQDIRPAHIHVQDNIYLLTALLSCTWLNVASSYRLAFVLLFRARVCVCEREIENVCVCV